MVTHLSVNFGDRKFSIRHFMRQTQPDRKLIVALVAVSIHSTRDCEVAGLTVDAADPPRVEEYLFSDSR